ncbi:MAG: dipeptidase PepE [Gemmataceae bacterium]
MRILLGSGGFRTQERIDFLASRMKDFFGDIPSLLFVPYALADHDRYVAEMTEKGINAGYHLFGIHLKDDPKEAIKDAHGLFVGGGNTFRLLKTLYDLELVELIRERVTEGMPYLGISAGANIASPTIMTTNDMPITQPPKFESLGLVPFQLNPHYYSGNSYVKVDGEYHPHFGETRDDRIREFHELNDTPVVGLWEAGTLRIEDKTMTLDGAPAKLFRKGKDPVDIKPPASFPL